MHCTYFVVLNLLCYASFTENVTRSEIDGFKVELVQGTNVLGIVVFSIVLGVVVGRMGKQGLPVKHFIDSLQEAIIIVVKIIIWYVWIFLYYSPIISIYFYTTNISKKL